MHPWQHYVAIGDSFTEGVGEPVTGLAMLGVAGRLATALRQDRRGRGMIATFGNAETTDFNHSEWRRT